MNAYEISALLIALLFISFVFFASFQRGQRHGYRKALNAIYRGSVGTPVHGYHFSTDILLDVSLKMEGYLNEDV